MCLWEPSRVPLPGPFPGDGQREEGESSYVHHEGTEDVEAERREFILLKKAPRRSRTAVPEEETGGGAKLRPARPMLLRSEDGLRPAVTPHSLQPTAVPGKAAARPPADAVRS